jgi:flavin-dependent dehydrogenase
MVPGTLLDADLAVIGAGPAGAATALFAARGGRRVVLIDRERFPRDKPCGEGLMPSGRAPLRALGLEAPLVASGAPFLNGIQFGLVGGSQAAVAFPTHGGEQAGLGVRRLEFDQRLVDAVEHEPRIRFQQGVRALDVRRSAAGPTLVTSNGDLRTRQLVVADGLRSAFRHKLGWTIGPRPPHRYGIVGHWQIDGPLDPWVRITFADGLELYEGPVSGDQRMVALLCSQSRMRTFGGQLQSRYRQLTLEIRPTLRTAQQLGSVSAVGPFWYRARTVANDGIFLVGDAAGFTDPITGEGIAAGLRQAQALSRALDTPSPEQAYRRAHRRLTNDPRRVANLLLRLSRTQALVERGLRSHQVAPQMLPKLLGVGFGYWGFSRITPREWLRMFTGW